MHGAFFPVFQECGFGLLGGFLPCFYFLLGFGFFAYLLVWGFLVFVWGFFLCLLHEFGGGCWLGVGYLSLGWF